MANLILKGGQLYSTKYNYLFLYYQLPSILVIT
nr:MAG TPA: hypothetical protein [Caudoviricetes sp.]